MNKKVVILFLILFYITYVSCNQKGTNIVTANTVVQSEMKQILKTSVEFFQQDAIIVDTVIGSFYISYTIKNNDDFVATYPIIEGKGQDTVFYVDRNISLTIGHDNEYLLKNRIINKSDFDIPNREKYHLNFFRINQITNEVATFRVSFCVPDTDICYWFDLNVNQKGRIVVNEIDLDDEVW